MSCVSGPLGWWWILGRTRLPRQGGIAHVAQRLGTDPGTLRSWVRRAEIDGGVRSGTTTLEAERIARLERENREMGACWPLPPSTPRRQQTRSSITSTSSRRR